MKQLYFLLSMFVAAGSLSAQTHEAAIAAQNKVREVETSSQSENLPDNYVDYHFEWNELTNSWDSTDITVAEFWGTSEDVNVRVQTMKRTENGMVEGDWYETYNMNMEPVDELDPLFAYTYYPGDSLHAVVDAPWFGIFPLSSYYTFNEDNQRVTEDSYYNERLLGNPGGLLYSLGSTVNHYDNGRLTDYVLVWEGLDSTHFYYDSEGRVDYSIEMIAEFGSTPEEYILREYAFDSEDRLISDVTTYYLDSLQTYDFKDSLVYKYNSGRDYDREEYYYDIDDEVYIQSGVVQYYFPEDTVEMVDIYQVSPSGTYVSERTRTVNDDEGRFLYMVTQESFGTFDPLSNATKVVRVYDNGTVSSTNELIDDLTELNWRKLDRELNFWWDESYVGALRLFTLDGRQVSSVQVNGTSVTLIVPDLPAGIYYVGLTNESGQVVGSASAYFE